MANDVTVFSKGGDWKAEIHAWKNNYLFYKSIGTEVTVYHREQTKNIWGSTVTDWVEKPATTIEITNRLPRQWAGGGDAAEGVSRLELLRAEGMGRRCEHHGADGLR